MHACRQYNCGTHTTKTQMQSSAILKIVLVLPGASATAVNPARTQMSLFSYTPVVSVTGLCGQRSTVVSAHQDISGASRGEQKLTNMVVSSSKVRSHNRLHCF